MELSDAAKKSGPKLHNDVRDKQLHTKETITLNHFC